MTVKYIFTNLLSLIVVLFISQNLALAQCTTFEESSDGEEAIEAHVIYRDFIKNENFTEAFDYWKTAFDAAPAANGKSSVQFTDGVAFFVKKYATATTDEEKKTISDKIATIYDQMAECYPDKKAFALGRKLYDMYYTVNLNRASIFAIGKAAIEAGGNKTEYIALIPTADGLVSQYKAGNVEVDEARMIFTKLHEIADYNIANNTTFKDHYQQSKDGMNGYLASIEPEIFDCQYFKNKYESQYNADPNNRELYRDIYKKLVQGGCDKATDSLLLDIASKDEVFLAEEKAARIKELQKDNPAWHASNLYKEGNFKAAVDKYDEAIATETDPEKKATYLFSKASIQFRKLNHLSAARASARKAASLKSGWGKPYMLIGDMYGSSARNCGDSWNQRLAILAAVEKYQYAKSIDSTVAGDASKRISKYRASFPDKSDGHMRGVKAGQKATAACWIGESVTVKFK